MLYLHSLQMKLTRTQFTIVKNFWILSFPKLKNVNFHFILLIYDADMYVSRINVLVMISDFERCKTDIITILDIKVILIRCGINIYWKTEKDKQLEGKISLDHLTFFDITLFSKILKEVCTNWRTKIMYFNSTQHGIEREMKCKRSRHNLNAY